MAVESPPSLAAPPAAPAPAAPAAPPPNMIDPLPVPTNPPRPGSAREKMQKETGKKWGEESPAAAAPAKGAETPQGGKTPEVPAARPGEQPAAAAAEVPPEITPEQKKKNPWVLLRESEKRAKALEQQMSEAKASSLAETEKSQYLDRITKAEAKLKEKEDELRFKSYEKSDEFKTKYEEPYEKAWQKHMKDLQGVMVTGEGGEAHEVKATDILDLVNLSLPDARKLATEKWGDFANEAMTARKEIRDLFESKTNALDEARKTGADREKQFQENAAKWRDDVQKHIKATWDEANQAALNHAINGEYFKPVEGDDTRNQLLGKGFALVDEAFGKNPTDPKLTTEERAAVVKKHAAVRNRAAAFGPMKYIIAKLRQEIDALKKANAEFKGSQPPAGGGTAAPAAGGVAAGGARSRMHAAGDRYAK